MPVRLRPMTESEFVTYREKSIREYAHLSGGTLDFPKNTLESTWPSAPHTRDL